MVQIADSEKEILKEWASEVDLSKVKIKTGLFAEVLCKIFGASAMTFGHSIFVRKKSSIAKYPSGHPLRLGLLAHELYHVKQEKEVGLTIYLLLYIPITAGLIVLGCVAKRSIRPSTISRYVGKHHLLEEQAYAIERAFYQKHWTEEEAKKWGWKPESEK